MYMKKNQMLMTSGTIWKQMLLFAFPVFLGNLFQQLYNTADSLIVGNYLGSSSLAAVTSCGELIFLLTSLFQGISVGAGVVIARYFGANDKERMQNAIHTLMAFGLIFGIGLTVFGYLLAPVLLGWMSTPKNVIHLSTVYLQIYFLGSLGMILYNSCVGIMQSVGDSKHPLYFLIVSSCVNVVLDIIFVAGLHMNVEGAALATILSQFLSAALCLYLLIRTNESHQVHLSEIRIHADVGKEILEMGIPTGIQNSLISISNVVVQSNINSFGSLAMAGIGTYTKIEGFAFLPITSFMMALTTFVSQNRGAKEYKRARKGAHFGLVCSVSLAETIGLLIALFATPLMRLFVDDPKVIQYGVERAHYATILFFLLAYSHGVSAVLRGVGKSVIPMVVMAQHRVGSQQHPAGNQHHAGGAGVFQVVHSAAGRRQAAPHKAQQQPQVSQPQKRRSSGKNPAGLYPGTAQNKLQCRGRQPAHKRSQPLPCQQQGADHQQHGQAQFRHGNAFRHTQERPPRCADPQQQESGSRIIVALFHLNTSFLKKSVA